MIEPLQRFIESSTLGEFASRVQMLFAFYKEMCHEEGSSWTTEGDFSILVISELYIWENKLRMADDFDIILIRSKVKSIQKMLICVFFIKRPSIMYILWLLYLFC